MEEKQPPGKIPAPAESAVIKDIYPDEDLLIEITDLTWEHAVEKSDKPVAVMFYSPTCTFCHQIDPYFRNYAEEYRDYVIFVHLNILTNPWITERYGIKSTPTFKFFCNGKPIHEMVGAIYPSLLKKIIDEVLIHAKECAKDSNLIDYDITGYG
jgi:thioredoxin 1